MADSRSTVELVFEGIDRTSEATRSALGNAQQFSQSLGNVTAPIADFTKDAVKLEAALLAAGGAITTFAIVAAGDFDEAFSEIATLLDEPIDALQGFRQEILDYASNSTQSLDSITDAVYSAISAGVEYTDSLEAVRQAEQLAVAGKGDLNDSLIVLQSSLNAYNLGVEDAERFSDALFQAIKSGQTTLAELSASLAQVTGSAATLEVPFETLLAAIASLTAQGTPTNRAVTQINAALNNLIKPTEQAKAAAEELGIEFGAEAVKAKGLENVLIEVMEATGGNEEQMGKLFGSVEALQAIFPLTGKAAEKFADTLGLMEDKAGVTETAYEKMVDSFGNANQKIVNAIENLLIKIGDPLLNEYGNMASAIAAIFNALGAEVAEGELGGIVDTIREIMAEAAAVLQNAADIVPDVDFTAAAESIQDGVEAVLTAVRELFRSFDLGSAEGLERAITGIAGAFEILSQFTAGVIESFQWIFDAIGNANEKELKVFLDRWSELAGKVAGFITQLDLLVPAMTAFFGTASTLVTILAGKQAVGIAGSAVEAAGGLKSLAGKLGRGSALAAALAFAISKVWELIDAFYELHDAKEREEKAVKSLAQANEEMFFRYADLSRELGVVIENEEDLIALQKEGLVAWDETEKRWKRTTDAAKEATEASITSEEQLERVRAALKQHAQETGQAYSESKGAIAEQADQVMDLTDWLAEADDRARGYTKTVGEDGVVSFEQFGGAGRKAFEDVEKGIDDAEKTSEEFRLGLAELASEERIATIDAQMQIDQAQIEAETAKIEAAFSSIDNTIESTGKLIGSLAGELAGVTSSSRTFNVLQEQLDAENRRRDEALELRKELTQAQIENMRERTKAMQSGKSLIEIDGAGLEPHLEAFMWEILRSIQTRVNEDGLEMLLGTEATG